ncbi:FecR family protein [Pedobacter aquatilis]|uniref:FecR family protein n=1 Tax=Pedobacter aquatilis TaxID=351343 RepID=UPI00292CCEA7|nr:FecR domain-containing protein [Pedobacter aquatilis]
MEEKSTARLTELFLLQTSGKASAAQYDELLGYFHHPLYLSVLDALMEEAISSSKGEQALSVQQAQEMLAQILPQHPRTLKLGKVRFWPRLAIAASLVAVLFAAGILLYQQNRKATPVNQYTQDITAGTTGATLTLADGKTIKLDGAPNGKLASQSGISIEKTPDGQLIYSAQGAQENPAQINTLTTAKGQTYQLNLPDGTKVFLNAASSIRYNASLVQKGIRSVTLQGEAYFEVAKDIAHPFFVETATQRLAVLGTHFNLNSYSDEPSVKTTLLEGSVKLETINSGEERPKTNLTSTILKPGEEASLTAGKAFQVSAVDAQEAIAWKNGKFIFENEPIEIIMRRLARWYNVEVSYQGEVKSRAFTGSVSRADNISSILDKITYTENIHFKIEGRRVSVMP